MRYALKIPYRDGTTHIVREPLDLTARLAARAAPGSRERQELWRRSRAAYQMGFEGFSQVDARGGS